MENETIFDEHSFKEEIKTASEARASYDYFTHNLTALRHELVEAGKSYEDVENTVRQCWTNLISSCQRVGYTNYHLQKMATYYGLSSEKKSSSEAGK